eukprot:1755955-Pleurochrysis_carterae.AAC.1
MAIFQSDDVRMIDIAIHDCRVRRAMSAPAVLMLYMQACAGTVSHLQFVSRVCEEEDATGAAFSLTTTPRVRVIDRGAEKRTDASSLDAATAASGRDAPPDPDAEKRRTDDASPELGVPKTLAPSARSSSRARKRKAVDEGAKENCESNTPCVFPMA